MGAVIHPGIVKDGGMRSTGMQRDDGVAVVCARLRGQHGKSLDTTFAIGYLSFLIYFPFLTPPSPLLQCGAELASSSSSPSPFPMPILEDLN